MSLHARPRRWPAAAALGMILAACAPAYDVETLYKQLQSSDVEERLEAQDKIDKIMRDGHYEVFVRGAMSPIKPERAPSLTYLAHMKQPEARTALRDFLHVEKRSLIPFNPIKMKATVEETDSRILVGHLIAENGGDPEAVAALTQRMQGQPSEVLVGTCYALGALRDPKGIPFLTESARNTDVEVARAAVQALGMFRSPEVVDTLRSLLKHPSPEVRSEVMTSLDLQDPAQSLELFKMIAASDPSPELRSAAFGELGRFRDHPPVPFLIEQLHGKDETNRRIALETLRLLTGQSFGPRPQDWERWWERGQQHVSARP